MKQSDSSGPQHLTKKIIIIENNLNRYIIIIIIIIKLNISNSNKTSRTPFQSKQDKINQPTEYS